VIAKVRLFFVHHPLGRAFAALVVVGAVVMLAILARMRVPPAVIAMILAMVVVLGDLLIAGPAATHE
jgi:hypothetical protein